jgi:hypothetical protein
LGVSQVKFLPCIGAVVALMALSSCTARFGGVPVAGDTLPELAELTAESVFDDFTTVAPCSLTDPSVFDTFGSATFGELESTLDYCTVLVRTAAGATVSVNVGLFEELAAAPELASQRVRDVEGGMWVGQRPGGTSFCTQVLVFPDGLTVEVYAYENEGEADMCSIVEAGMDHLIEVVLAGNVAHRSPAPNSLVGLDPCALVGDDDIAAVPGFAGMRRSVDYPGKHKCRWALGSLGVVVAFGARQKPSADRALPVAGRPTVTIPVELPERSYCTVETGHIPFTEVAGVADQVELASVFVNMPPEQSAAACTAAHAVAEVLWPKLPAA